ncbi:hypothetical protein JTB14_036327 [Gonioctena quinquepunctata]|nr:hypothetical protein JTB14_036327 [Gonioctena quinquepunctata]
MQCGKRWSTPGKKKRCIIITDSLSTLNALPEMYPTHTILISMKHELWKAYRNGITLKLMTMTVILTDMKPFLKNIQSKARQAEWDITDTELSEVKKSILPHKIIPKK